MSDILEKTDEKVTATNDGDHDRFQHYFFKKDIDANLMDGTPMRAMCGKILDRQVDPKGRPICQECIDFYAQMQDA